jgi:hypothetical protein
MSVRKSASPLAVVAVAVAALALGAGCSGQSHGGGSIPSAPEAPAGIAMTASTLSITIQTLLPPAHAPQVVALGFELDGKAKSFVSLDIASKACTKKKNGDALSCRVDLKTTFGSHWVTVYGYKNPLAGGKVPTQKPIATNGVPVDATATTASLQLAMYSPIASVLVSGASAAIDGNQKQGFFINRIAGPNTVPFAMLARDAAKRILIGPSTAAFAIKRSNAKFMLATPQPNQFVLDSTAITTAATTTIDVTAKGTTVARCSACKVAFDVTVSAKGDVSPSPSPSPSTSPGMTPTPTASPTPVGTAMPTPVPTATPLPAVFITYSTPATPGAIRAFDEQGHTRTLAGSWANLGEPSGITYDSSNAWFYVLTSGASAPIASYDVAGDQIPLSGSFTMTPGGVTADGNHNHIFVPTHVGTGNDTILGYDEEGNALSLSPGFASTLVAAGPNALAFDPDNNRLYFANSSSGKVEEYDLSGNSVNVSTKFAQPSGCAGSCVPTAVMYAHYNVWPYVIWKNGSQYYVAFYTSTGSTIGSFIPTVSAPVAMAADDSSRTIYVVGATSVEVTDEFGSAQTTSGAFDPPAGATAATGIAIVPPAGPATRRSGRAIHPRR